MQADSYRLSPREAHSGGNRLVDTGNLTQPRRPMPGWANSHSLGAGEDVGRAIMGAPPPPPPAPPGVFGRPWIYFRSGPQYWSPGSWYLWGLWHLWSVEGTEVAPFPWGQGSYPRKKCQLQRLQEKPVLPSLQRRLLTLKVCGSSPPRTVGWHFRDRQRDSLWPGEHQKVQWPAGMQEHRSQAQKSSG